MVFLNFIYRPRTPNYLELALRVHFFVTGARLSDRLLQPNVYIMVIFTSCLHVIADQPNLKKCSRKHFEGILC